MTDESKPTNPHGMAAVSNDPPAPNATHATAAPERLSELPGHRDLAGIDELLRRLDGLATISIDNKAALDRIEKRLDAETKVVEDRIGKVLQQIHDAVSSHLERQGKRLDNLERNEQEQNSRLDAIEGNDGPGGSKEPAA